MTRDNNKGISIDYNYLNLPQQITFDSGDEIHYLYTAEGQKLQKRIVEQAGSTSKTEYFGGRIYESGQLKEIAHEEGRILATTTGFEYHYYLRDHLGNVRVEFKEDANGEATITQENHYYPFGMRFSGEVFANNDNDFRYNAKELQGDFGLDWYDYGARMYDASLGRFTTVDPWAEKYTFQSPYLYAYNNPIRYTDMLGLGANDEVEDDEEEEEKPDEQKLIEYYQNLGYDVNNFDDVKNVVDEAKYNDKNRDGVPDGYQYSTTLELDINMSLGLQLGVKVDFLVEIKAHAGGPGVEGKRNYAVSYLWEEDRFVLSSNGESYNIDYDIGVNVFDVFGISKKRTYGVYQGDQLDKKTTLTRNAYFSEMKEVNGKEDPTSWKLEGGGGAEGRAILGLGVKVKLSHGFSPVTFNSSIFR